MKAYDIVIAGAGVAGCLAARDLARQGHSVLVVEKEERSGMGHDWWDTVETGIFDEVGLPDPGPEEWAYPYNFEILTPFGDTGIRAVMPPCQVNVDRKPLAARLLAAAQDAGADIIFETSVRGPIVTGGMVTGVYLETPDNSTSRAESKICIDATGCGGVLREKLPEKFGFRRHLMRDDFVITYREIRADTSAGRGRSILIVRNDGALWLSRDPAGRVDILACAIDAPGRPNPRDMVAELIANEGGVGNEILRGGYGGRIPVGRGFDSFVAPGFMIAGDSASMAHPLNGSGISTAMRAARLAARTAHNALVSGRCGVAELWPYNVEYKRAQDVKFARLYMLKQLLRTEPLGNMHLFMRRGLFSPGSFWDTEQAVDIGANLEKLPQYLSMLDRPFFVGRIAATIALIGLLDQHYKNYPAKYDPHTFKLWKRRTAILFSLVPRAK